MIPEGLGLKVLSSIAEVCVSGGIQFLKACCSWPLHS